MSKIWLMTIEDAAVNHRQCYYFLQVFDYEKGINRAVVYVENKWYFKQNTTFLFTTLKHYT